MATDKKISELADADALTGPELVEVVQGGVNKKTTTQAIADLGGGAVDSVNGQTGVVQVNADDVPFIPAGNIAATDVQAAIEELDSEKQSAAQVSSAITAAVVGVKDLWIPAGALQPRTTNGSDILRPYEMTTSLFNVTALAFDQTTQEFADFQFVLPRTYNNGTIVAIPYWTAQSGSGTVQWGVSFGSYRNDDALTVALGSAQTSDDTLIATNDLHIGPATSAITPAGTVAAGNLMAGRISRNPASDTLSADALLIGIMLYVTVTGQIDG